MSFSVIFSFVVLGLIWYGIYKAYKMLVRGTGKVLGVAGNVTGKAASKYFPELAEEASRLGKTSSVPSSTAQAQEPASEPIQTNDEQPAFAFQQPENFGQRTPPPGAAPSFLQRTPQGAKRSPLVQAAPTPLTPEDTPVSEPVTAVLRRQVPPRDEAPRSWIGGKPMMPAHVEWPRGISSEDPERGPQPLHFVAQISCEDLPADLWGGVGPRTGWLLFFLAANACCPDAEGDRAVLHIDALGEQRMPPEDSAPVHDGVYTGGSYNWLPKDEVPAHWRGWPVDLVEMANRLYENEHGYPAASPESFAEKLYEGQQVAPEERPGGLPSLRAMTYGQAVSSVEALATKMRSRIADPFDDTAREMLVADGGQERLIEGLRADLAKIEQQDREKMSAEQIGWQENRKAFLENVIEAFGPLSAADSLSQILTVHADRLKWRESVAEGCDRIAIMLGKSPPDAPLDERHWEELVATFEGKRDSSLELFYCDWGDDKVGRLTLAESGDPAEIESPPGIDQFAIDVYLDPETRGILPADYVASREPVWRTLVDNIPHRMGGYHDGVQSEPDEDGTGDMLLLQLNSDDAMDWCWGDVGAYYFWIKRSDLAAGDFGKVELILECH
ncbi:DUF1963 domain-containing protein [Qipengyuania sp. DSG2-2]|uniref:DUF1963 domain-containing protein n=1 Tax=Qipengyuania sp. DGS2-2 TaxID=3349631 RepID=UPI0036D244B1